MQARLRQAGLHCIHGMRGVISDVLTATTGRVEPAEGKSGHHQYQRRRLGHRRVGQRQTVALLDHGERTIHGVGKTCGVFSVRVDVCARTSFSVFRTRQRLASFQAEK